MVPLNVTGFCKLFADRSIERSGSLRAHAFAELMAATDQRSVSWDSTTPAFNKMLKALTECSSALSQTAFGDLTQALAAFGPIQDGGVLHIVLDQVSRAVKRPVLDTTNTLAAEIFEGASMGLSCPIEAQKQKQKQKLTQTRTLTHTPTQTQNTCELVKYPTTLDEHLAALDAKKGA